LILVVPEDHIGEEVGGPGKGVVELKEDEEGDKV
jgi:hypothetical protein